MIDEGLVSVAIPKGQQVLIVEDSLPTRRLFRKTLESLDLVVVESADGAEALNYLEGHLASVALVFSDLNMPRVDGFELCRRLKQASWYDGTPLVAVSTSSDVQAVIKVLKMGADDFIPKPFDKTILAKVIRRVMDHD